MLISISVAHKGARYWNQSWTHANYFLFGQECRSSKQECLLCAMHGCKLQRHHKIFRRRRLIEAAMYIYTPLVSVNWEGEKNMEESDLSLAILHTGTSKNKIDDVSEWSWYLMICIFSYIFI
jgi:hypothetical protein